VYRSVGACEGARGSTPSDPADPRRTPSTDPDPDRAAGSTCNRACDQGL